MRKLLLDHWSLFIPGGKEDFQHGTMDYCEACEIIKEWVR